MPYLYHQLVTERSSASFCHTMLCISTAYGIMQSQQCLSVCLSHNVYCVQTNKHRHNFFTIR